MPLAAPLLQRSLRDRPPDQQGKVRDLYDFGDRLLIGATDLTWLRTIPRVRLLVRSWNKQPPVPSLPDDVITKTRDKYVEAFHRLTGRELL